MTQEAMASSADSTQAGGSARGPLRRALATRDARDGSNGSGAPSPAGSAGPSRSSPSPSPPSRSPPLPPARSRRRRKWARSPTSPTLREHRRLDRPGQRVRSIYQFEISTDGTTWTDRGGGFIFGNDEQAVGPLEITGLKGGTKYFVRLRATNNIEEGITPEPYPEFTTLAVDPPVIAATNDASSVFSTSATGTGAVKRPVNTNPAFDVNCRFEYVTAADFAATGYSKATVRDCQPNPIGPADANVNKVVSAPLGCTNPVVEAPEEKCLTPATTYHLRIVTENSSPTVVSKEATNTFTTAPTVAKPSVLATNNATAVSYRDAKVSGEIERPAGTDPALNTSCRFEFVKDPDFKATAWEKARQTPCVQAPAETPYTGTGPKPVSADLTFLRHDMVYHFRLTAANGGGVVSKDAASTFTTPTGTPPTLVVNPIPPSAVTHTTVHVTGTLDPGTPTRALSFGWMYSTDPNAPDDKWQGIGICCGAEGNKAEYSWDFTELKPGTKYYVRMIAYDYTYLDEGEGFILYSPAPYESFTTKGTNTPPSVTLDPVGSGFTASTAHFVGTVNTNAPAGPLPDDAKGAYSTKWHFECIPVCKNINENTIEGVVQAEEGLQPVVGDAARLDPNEFYEVKLIATNALGTVETQVETFNTTHIKPTVKSAEGASDGKGGYTIQGIVNPNNSKVTDCKFEWGPTAPDYAFSAPCSPMPAGRDEVQVLSTEALAPFKLEFRGQVTNLIKEGSEPGLIEAELEALPKIGAGGIAKVTKESAFFAWIYHVTFGGKHSEKNVETINILIGSEVRPAQQFTKGGNSLPVVVEAYLPGLTPGAVYHFNLLATNGAGKSQSGDTEFVPVLFPPESCPNEQLRRENLSLGLPECRAYEVVTPPGKEGFRTSLFSLGRDAYGDDRVVFISAAGNLAKSGQNGVFGNSYVSVRKASGWETVANLNGPAGTLKDAPSLVTTPTGLFGTFAYSEDLMTSVWTAHRQDGVNGENYYLRNEDGTFTLIGPNDGTQGRNIFEASAASADLKHLIRWGGFGSIWGPGVYETIGVGNVDPPRRVDVDNTGSPISACGGIAANGRTISRDGRVIVVGVAPCESGPPAEELWARIGGTTSVNVSASHCTRTVPACNAPVDPTFVATTPDGSRVFFTTTQQLVNEDTDQTNDIYACDIPAGTPAPSRENKSLLGVQAGLGRPKPAPPKSRRFLTTSDNGSTVLFAAKGVLADNEDALGEEAGRRRPQSLRLARRCRPSGRRDDLRRQAQSRPRVRRRHPDDPRRPLPGLHQPRQLLDTDTDDAQRRLPLRRRSRRADPCLDQRLRRRRQRRRVPCQGARQKRCLRRRDQDRLRPPLRRSRADRRQRRTRRLPLDARTASP